MTESRARIAATARAPRRRRADRPRTADPAALQCDALRRVPARNRNRTATRTATGGRNQTFRLHREAAAGLRRAPSRSEEARTKKRQTAGPDTTNTTPSPAPLVREQTTN